MNKQKEYQLMEKKIIIYQLLKKSFSSGCLKMPRCKAPLPVGRGNAADGRFSQPAYVVKVLWEQKG
jgi:hypothetical protein